MQLSSHEALTSVFLSQRRTGRSHFVTEHGPYVYNLRRKIVNLVSPPVKINSFLLYKRLCVSALRKFQAKRRERRDKRVKEERRRKGRSCENYCYFLKDLRILKAQDGNGWKKG